MSVRTKRWGVKDLLVPVAVALFCYAAVTFSPMTLFVRWFSLTHSPFFLLFEMHFWQYAFAFLAVIILSRGHLWSYGINSQNLKVSMQWLAWLYSLTLLITVGAVMLEIPLLPAGAAAFTGGTKETIIASLVYWMSSPVANQILFFSFAQTVLIKQWGEGFRVGGYPVAVLIAAMLFALFATTSSFGEDPAMFLPMFVFGLYCGIVYWRTNSLIAPMLGHAFFFGFPFFIHLLRTTPR